jgi:8-amino-7-oxononanoate synthase
MDGDTADLRGLVALKREHGAMLMVDEAHATLVFGEHGGGLCREQGVSDQVEIQMGTLSKAFGAQGGFIATSNPIKEWLLNRGRPYVFSTALPLPIVAAAREAIELVRRDPEIRSRLWDNIRFMSRALDRTLLSPIIPIILGNEERVLEASAALGEVGLHVTAIRPPTVPAGTSRLRVTLSAAHDRDDLERLINAMGKLNIL